MAQIESINWDLKRFYLHADTALNGFDAWEAYSEVRGLVQANANNEQNYRLFLQRAGKVKKNLAGTKFTPKFVTFEPGWRGVPYAGSDHELLLLTEMLNTQDGVADRAMFDRSGLSNKVDIDPVYEQTEIIVVDEDPWERAKPTNPTPGTWGHFVGTRLLTFLNFLGHK